MTITKAIEYLQENSDAIITGSPDAWRVSTPEENYTGTDQEVIEMAEMLKERYEEIESEEK